MSIDLELFKQIESEMLSNISYILVFKEGTGVNVEAIFSSYEKAYKHMIRNSMNQSLEWYREYVEDIKDTDEKLISFKEYVADPDIDSCHKILHTNHLDLSKPIYIVRNGNHISRGEPCEYLFNSESEWKKSMDKLFTGGYNENIEENKIRVDPELPEIDESNFE